MSECWMESVCSPNLGPEKKPEQCHLEAHGRPKLVRAVLREALPGRPETQLREKAGWGRDI